MLPRDTGLPRRLTWYWISSSSIGNSFSLMTLVPMATAMAAPAPGGSKRSRRVCPSTILKRGVATSPTCSAVRISPAGTQAARSMSRVRSDQGRRTLWRCTVAGLTLIQGRIADAPPGRPISEAALDDLAQAQCVAAPLQLSLQASRPGCLQITVGREDPLRQFAALLDELRVVHEAAQLQVRQP